MIAEFDDEVKKVDESQNNVTKVFEDMKLHLGNDM